MGPQLTLALLIPGATGPQEQSMGEAVCPLWSLVHSRSQECGVLTRLLLEGSQLSGWGLRRVVGPPLGQRQTQIEGKLGWPRQVPWSGTAGAEFKPCMQGSPLSLFPLALSPQRNQVSQEPVKPCFPGPLWFLPPGPIGGLPLQSPGSGKF